MMVTPETKKLVKCDEVTAEQTDQCSTAGGKFNPRGACELHEVEAPRGMKEPLHSYTTRT